jgi:hypothetical protein
MNTKDFYNQCAYNAFKAAEEESIQGGICYYAAPSQLDVLKQILSAPPQMSPNPYFGFPEKHGISPLPTIFPDNPDPISRLRPLGPYERGYPRQPVGSPIPVD